MPYIPSRCSLFFLFPLLLVLPGCFGPLDPFNPPPDSFEEVIDSPASGGFPSGMLAWYTCNDSATSTLIDTVGKFNGQISSCTRETGISGQALRFSGSSYVSGKDSIASFGSGDFTVSLWVKPQIVTEVTDTSRFNIISNGIATEKGFTISITKNGCFTAFVGQSSTPGRDTSLLATDGKWHHLALVRGNTQVRLFVDGKNSQSYESTGNMTTGLSFLLGRDGDPSTRPERFFTGLIDEVKILNKAWDAQAVSKENSRFLH